MSRGAGEIEHLISKSEMLELIVCPVCMETPLPPIYNCVKGHIICSECRPKMTKCGLCQCEYSGGRNYTVEAIANAALFHCKYKEKGCQEVVIGKSYSDHLWNCEFRPTVACHENKHKCCNGESIHFYEYLAHLENTHSATGFEEEHEYYSFYQVADEFLTEDSFTLDRFPFDSQWFLMKWIIRDDFVCWWVSLIGPSEEYSKYKTALILHSRENRLEKKSPIFQWCLPVHSIHENEAEIIEGGNYAAIPIDQARTFPGTKDKGKEWKHSLHVLCIMGIISDDDDEYNEEVVDLLQNS